MRNSVAWPIKTSFCGFFISFPPRRRRRKLTTFRLLCLLGLLTWKWPHPHTVRETVLTRLQTRFELKMNKTIRRDAKRGSSQLSPSLTFKIWIWSLDTFSLSPDLLQTAGGNLWWASRGFYVCIPLEIHPKGSYPAICSYKARGLAKKSYKMNGFRQTILHTKCRAVCINHLFAAPPHFVGRYVLPGCLISIFFWIWIFLACLDPEPQKRHHFVRTCCSAIYLRFSHSALNCL